MINFTDLLQSSGWKNFMAKLYGLGAAVVKESLAIVADITNLFLSEQIKQF